MNYDRAWISIRSRSGHVLMSNEDISEITENEGALIGARQLMILIDAPL